MIKYAYAFVIALLLTGTADARDQSEPTPRRWYVRIGPARAVFDESAKVSVGGMPVPGGSAKLSNNWGVAAEGGYYLYPNVSLSLTVGVPPTTTIRATGSLASVGALARISYGPAVAAIEYHLATFDAVRPYVGAGINYTLVVRTKNLISRNAHIDDAVGPALIAGIEVPVNSRIALFADYKKIWTSTNARFDLPTPFGLLPGQARVRLNPSLINTGLTYKL